MKKLLTILGLVKSHRNKKRGYNTRSRKTRGSSGGITSLLKRALSGRKY